MLIDKGLNDLWHIAGSIKNDDALYCIALREPLNRHREKEIVSYPFAHNVKRVTCNEKDVQFQRTGKYFSLLAEQLTSGEIREYQVETTNADIFPPPCEIISFKEVNSCIIADNGRISLMLPASRSFDDTDQGIDIGNEVKTKGISETAKLTLKSKYLNL